MQVIIVCDDGYKVKMAIAPSTTAHQIFNDVSSLRYSIGHDGEEQQQPQRIVVAYQVNHTNANNLEYLSADVPLMSVIPPTTNGTASKASAAHVPHFHLFGFKSMKKLTAIQDMKVLSAHIAKAQDDFHHAMEAFSKSDFDLVSKLVTEYSGLFGLKQSSSLITASSSSTSSSSSDMVEDHAQLTTAIDTSLAVSTPVLLQINLDPTTMNNKSIVDDAVLLTKTFLKQLFTLLNAALDSKQLKLSQTTKLKLERSREALLQTNLVSLLKALQLPRAHDIVKGNSTERSDSNASDVKEMEVEAPPAAPIDAIEPAPKQTKKAPIAPGNPVVKAAVQSAVNKAVAVEQESAKAETGRLTRGQKAAANKLDAELKAASIHAAPKTVHVNNEKMEVESDSESGSSSSSSGSESSSDEDSGSSGSSSSGSKSSSDEDSGSSSSSSGSESSSEDSSDELERHGTPAVNTPHKIPQPTENIVVNPPPATTTSTSSSSDSSSSESSSSESESGSESDSESSDSSDDEEEAENVPVDSLPTQPLVVSQSSVTYDESPISISSSVHNLTHTQPPETEVMVDDSQATTMDYVLPSASRKDPVAESEAVSTESSDSDEDSSSDSSSSSSSQGNSSSDSEMEVLTSGTSQEMVKTPAVKTINPKTHSALKELLSNRLPTKSPSHFLPLHNRQIVLTQSKMESGISSDSSDSSSDSEDDTALTSSQQTKSSVGVTSPADSEESKDLLAKNITTTRGNLNKKGVGANPPAKNGTGSKATTAKPAGKPPGKSTVNNNTSNGNNNKTPKKPAATKGPSAVATTPATALRDLIGSSANAAVVVDMTNDDVADVTPAKGGTVKKAPAKRGATSNATSTVPTASTNGANKRPRKN